MLCKEGLRARIRSHSAASCSSSGCGRLGSSSSLLQRKGRLHHPARRQLAVAHARPKGSGGGQSGSSAPDEVLAETEWEDNDFRLLRKQDVEPDFDDPEWPTKITDWSDFWNYQRWDLETEGVDLDTDVAGNDTRTLERAFKLADALESLEQRTDVLNFLGPQARRDHSDAWLDPPVVPVKQEEVPEMSDIDLRALSEKMKKRELLDIEWRRQQSKIGKVGHLDHDNDVRMEQFVLEQDLPEWSDEQFYNLITQDGTAARPEDHGAIVQNPLLVTDLVNTMGVKYIPETEEFLEEIGHLGVPSKLKRLPMEVVIDLERDVLSSTAKDELLNLDDQIEEFEAADAIPWDNTYTGDPREWTND